MSIKITRINNFEYSFKLSSNSGVRHVAKALTFRNPDPFAYSSKIEKFNKRKFTFRIGMLNTLEKYIKVKRLSYSISDYEYNLPDGVEIDDRMSGRYIHQRRAVEAFYRKRFGIIVVPTRGGKTFIASEIMRIFLNTDDGKFLFLTDNTTLFNQAVGDFSAFFFRYGGLKIGEIRAGKVETSERVTVGMIQTIQSTLSRRCRDLAKKKELSAYLRELKFLTIDEIHDNCSDSKLAIYKKCKRLEYQLCLSATPYRSGAFVQNLKLREWSGDVIYNITEKTLRKRGVLSDYKVFMLWVNHNNIAYPDMEDAYDVYRKELIFRSEYRTRVLMKVLTILQKLNIKTLLLFSSVEHGRAVEHLTGIPFICGEDDAEKREEAIRKLLEGDGGILSASGIFKKGVTLPSVRCAVNVDGGLEDANTIQKKGRVLGVTKDKSRSVILDFFDQYDAYFTDHSLSRLRTYVNAVGERSVDVLDTKVDDYDSVLEARIKKWFNVI